MVCRIGRIMAVIGSSPARACNRISASLTPSSRTSVPTGRGRGSPRAPDRCAARNAGSFLPSAAPPARQPLRRPVVKRRVEAMSPLATSVSPRASSVVTLGEAQLVVLPRLYRFAEAERSRRRKCLRVSPAETARSRAASSNAREIPSALKAAPAGASPCWTRSRAVWSSAPCLRRLLLQRPARWMAPIVRR